MAYKFYENSSDTLDKILDKYTGRKVFILKQDVICEKGKFLANSIVRIFTNETNVYENKPKVELMIYDFSEKTYDVLTINSESNNELADTLESLFAFDDTRTEYYEQYNQYEIQFNEIRVKYDTKITNTLLFTGIMGVIFLLLIICKIVPRISLIFFLVSASLFLLSPQLIVIIMEHDTHYKSFRENADEFLNKITEDKAKIKGEKQI